MKVIDLLNKIANGEDVPNEIIYHGNYYYNVGNKEQAYYENNELEDNLFLCAVYNEGHLNDEIEIIEDKPKEDIPKEDKKIAKIGKLNQVSNNKQHLNNYILRNKINEIIDRLNGEDNEC